MFSKERGPRTKSSHGLPGLWPVASSTRKAPSQWLRSEWMQARILLRTFVVSRPSRAHQAPVRLQSTQGRWLQNSGAAKQARSRRWNHFGDFLDLANDAAILSDILREAEVSVARTPPAVSASSLVRAGHPAILLQAYLDPQEPSFLRVPCIEC